MSDRDTASTATFMPTWADTDWPEHEDVTTRRFDVVWQADDRSFHTVGELEIDQDASGMVAASRFRYVADVASVPGFRPFAAFPEFPPTALGDSETDARWQWEQRDGLLSMFRNRVLSPRRSDFVVYAEALGLGEGADPVELLARSGGGRATDTVHIVPHPEVGHDGIRTMLFLVSGVRHVDPDGAGAMTLKRGDVLSVRPEPDNEYNPRALLLDTTSGRPVGYVPNYLLDKVYKHVERGGDVRVRAEHVNGQETPAHLRLLARLDFVPTAEMSQGEHTRPH